MNKKIISVVIATSLVLSFSGCGKKDEKPEDALEVNVSVSTAQKADVRKSINYTGEVKASSSASVSSKVSSSVEAIYVEIGDYVNAGDVLMRLDSTQYSLAYSQAKAAYSSALAAKNNAEASYNNLTGGSHEQSKVSMNQAVANAESAYNAAVDNYNRQKALFDIGAVSKVSLESAQTSMNNAKIALDSAKANAELNEQVVIPQTQAGASAGLDQASAGVQQAKVAMDIAANNLANCTVTAPISGYISSKSYTVGQMASPGYEAFSIKNSEMLDIEINVTESVISSVEEGSTALVDIKSANLKGLEAVVSNVAKAKNDATGLFTIKVAIDNKDEKIKVGMMADVFIPTDTVENALTVDYNSLILENDTYYVYVIKGNKAYKTKIEVGITDGKKAQVLSGLKAGDKVAVDGKDFLSETNDKVRVVK